MKKAPGVFLGVPDDFATTDMSLIDFENESLRAAFDGNKEKALMAGGEGAQRITDMPKVNDLVQNIVKEAEKVLKNVQTKFLA